MFSFLNRIKKQWHRMKPLDKAVSSLTAIIIAAFLAVFVLVVSGKFGLLIIKTSSMYEAISPGSLLIFKPTEIEEIQTGEIIAFREDRFSNSLITHRAVGKVFQKGELFIKTKGDSNHRVDSGLVGKDELVGREVYVIPQAGRILAFTRTPVGMLLLNLMLLTFILLIIIDKVRLAERRSYVIENGTLVNPSISSDKELMA